MKYEVSESAFEEGLEKNGIQHAWIPCIGQSLEYWGCTSHNKVGTVESAEQNVDAKGYKNILVNDLWPVVEKYLPSGNFIFFQDNVPVHRTRPETKLSCFPSLHNLQWKSAEAMQTLRAGWSKVEPKFLALLLTPFLGMRDGQNLISWRWSLPSATDPVWWRSMHTISSYRGNRRLQYTAPQLSAQCKYKHHWKQMAST